MKQTNDLEQIWNYRIIEQIGGTEYDPANTYVAETDGRKVCLKEFSLCRAGDWK